VLSKQEAAQDYPPLGKHIKIKESQYRNWSQHMTLSKKLFTLRTTEQLNPFLAVEKCCGLSDGLVDSIPSLRSADSGAISGSGEPLSFELRIPTTIKLHRLWGTRVQAEKHSEKCGVKDSTGKFLHTQYWSG